MCIHLSQTHFSPISTNLTKRYQVDFKKKNYKTVKNSDYVTYQTEKLSST